MCMLEQKERSGKTLSDVNDAVRSAGQLYTLDDRVGIGRELTASEDVFLVETG